MARPRKKVRAVRRICSRPFRQQAESYTPRRRMANSCAAQGLTNPQEISAAVKLQRELAPDSRAIRYNCARRARRDKIGGMSEIKRCTACGTAHSREGA
jgi:hypothetical protein